MKTSNYLSQTNDINIENKELILAFRLEISKLVEAVFNEVLDDDGLSKNERINILEKLTTIDGLLRQNEVTFGEVAREAHDLAFEAFQLLKDERNEEVVRRLQILDLECEAYLRESCKRPFVGIDRDKDGWSDEAEQDEETLAYA